MIKIIGITLVFIMIFLVLSMTYIECKDYEKEEKINKLTSKISNKALWLLFIVLIIEVITLIIS